MIISRQAKNNLVLAIACIASILLGTVFVLSDSYQIPNFKEVKNKYQPSEAWLLDRHGSVIAIKRVNNKSRQLEWVSLDQISRSIQSTIISSEDQHFYQHAGVDWVSLVWSGMLNVKQSIDGKRPRGASTITMQLAGFLDHSLAPSNSKRTISQKLRQIMEAREIEKTWTKTEILEAYLNLASFRGETIGINSASYVLFGSNPSSLNHSQSLILAALLKGPTAPKEQVAKRACALIKKSVQETVSCESLQELVIISLNLQNFYVSEDNIAPHLGQKLLNKAGVKISTTLDANLQRFAIQSLHEHLMLLGDQNVKDGAIIVIDNKTGDVLAYVGSSGELSDAKEVDGVIALRQAGSTLKPFLYGEAIDEKKVTVASIMDDSPIQLITPIGLYVPQNYDHDFKGPVSVRTALASSLNVPAVRMLGLVGVDKFTNKLRAFGLNSVTQNGDYYGFSLALGGVDIRLSELANGYRAIANQGILNSIRFTKEQLQDKPRPVISKQAAYIIKNILSDRNARAVTFGLDNPLATKVWTAVKTGTSKDMRDNWCVGFSSHYTVGVWVGNFNGNSMRDVSGVTGAALVWRDMIDFLHRDERSIEPKMPKNVIAKQIRFTPQIESPRTEWFVKGTELNEIRLVNVEKSLSHKILYPTNGTIIAIDPDIPPMYQRVQLSSKGSHDEMWEIDGNKIGKGEEINWAPTGGHHNLTITNSEGIIFDAVSFEVRGDLSMPSSEEVVR